MLHLVALFLARLISFDRLQLDPTLFIATLSGNYLDNILVRMTAASVGADEALMLSLAGNMAFGSAGNVFVVKERRLKIPPLSAGILAGIARATMIEIAKGERIRVEEENLTLNHLYAGDEVFLTNSLMGMMALTRLRSKPIGDGRPGPITCDLHLVYEELAGAPSPAL